jgi:hypothetical protein
MTCFLESLLKPVFRFELKLNLPTNFVDPSVRKYTEICRVVSEMKYAVVISLIMPQFINFYK